MFELLIYATFAVALLGAVYAYAGSRDVFHPLMYLAPMLVMIYGWMPLKLAESGGLDGFFQNDQVVFVQAWNLAGVAALVLGCLIDGSRVPQMPGVRRISEHAGRTLVVGGAVAGLLGLAAWGISIINVGGLREAFSRPYSGGWDDSGYIRDGTLLMYPGFLLMALALTLWRFRVMYVLLLGLFIVPWMIQAAFTTRRGPTFMILVIIAMAWYLNRRTRPPVVLTIAGGLGVGLLMLFLVSNRGNIYLGSDQQMNTEITNIVEKPDTGNEYIYGAGSLLSADQRNSFYWGRRYLAQLFVRPIPSSVWPTKYEDMGVGELTRNAGTGEGLRETLGWEGANGAAPGMMADLWAEFHWFFLIAAFFIGRAYAWVWRQAQLQGGPWVAQYIVLAALSVYLVMQTMEAVIFRVLLMSVPIWVSWRIAMGPRPKRSRFMTYAQRTPEQAMAQ